MIAFYKLSYQQKLLWLIFAATILRLVFAQTGLGIDETYTVATSRVLHMSTFDHPPLTWWLSWFMQTVFHTNAPNILRLPFVLLSAIATWQMARLTTILFGEKAGLYAALAFVCAPALGITSGTWVLPDGPLIVCLLAGAICLARLFFQEPQKGWLWLGAGIFGGFALLSKYHGIFLFGGAGLFVLTTKNVRPWLLTPWPYAGALLGLIIFTPVLIWNVQHDWVSFAFQSGRIGDTHINPLKLLQTIMGQALFLTPYIWAGLIFVGWKALCVNTSDSKRWLLLCLALPQIALFTLASLAASSAMLFHWAMPGYLFLLPLLGDWMAQQNGNSAVWTERASLASSLMVTILVFGVVSLWFLDVGNNRDFLISMRSFDGINSYIDAKGFSKRSDIIVAPTKWYISGKFDYALNGRLVVTCLCRDAREFGITAPLQDMLGKDFIIPIPLKNIDASEKSLTHLFEKVSRLDNLRIRDGNSSSESFAIIYGNNLQILPTNDM